MEDSDTSVLPDMSLQADTVPVSVSGGEWSGIQLCPALVIGSAHGLPGAVKHIYSRLASAANEVDQGVPDVILSVVSHQNSLSTKYMSCIENAIKRFIINCGLWIISSGEVNDPLARIASSTLKNTLPQLERPAEVLHILLNSDEVIASDEAASTKSIVDTSLNTLMLICRQNDNASQDIGKVRAAAVVKLAHPPPALLIGVPSEPMSPASNSAILLSPSNDKRPFPVVLFAGNSRESLAQLLFYVEHGVPVIVLQDSCELCAILHAASLLQDSPAFQYDKFIEWLESQLSVIGITESTELVSAIFAAATSGDTNLIEFIDIQQMNEFASIVVNKCLECYATTGEEKQVLLLAAKLNSPTVLSSMDVAAQLDEELLTMILCECVSKDDQLQFLSSVLQLSPSIRVTSNMLIKMMHHADEEFFTTIVLCQCMGYSYLPSTIDSNFALSIQKLVGKLSYGFDNLFDPNAFCNDYSPQDNDESIRILAIWSLLLHRPGIVKCLATFTDDPIGFSLILSRIARSLARESHDWHFYEESLLKLSNSLLQTCTKLFDAGFSSSPTKAYQLLCEPIEPFYRFNITQLAFHCNARELIAHECCQRWVHRKLYGNLQAKKSPSFCPKWLKIIISAVLMIPIKFWMLVRPTTSIKTNEVMSPTVALLDVARMSQRHRAVSTYSVVSSRSEALTTLTAPLSTAMGLNSVIGAESATPQSIVFPLTIEENEKESKQFGKMNRLRRAHAPSFGTFYSTPIVKYWLSLLFRLMFIGCLAYSVMLPGCGSNIWDTIMWTWSFFWWIESLFVLAARAQKIPLNLISWRVFDVVVFAMFLLLLLMMKVFPLVSVLQKININSIYAAKVVSACFVLYVCYSTLFIYIPLSDIFGPMVVRIKLMLLRDFTNFFFMISLVMLSSAVAIQSVVYPDRELSPSVVKNLLSWIWLSLFTTDLSSLKESADCRRSFIGAPKQYCWAVGEHADASCPTQTLPAFLVVIEYLIMLKLILWPILFAFFAKTAKNVDEEADKIWRFQLYSLAEDFRLRPPLPPPFTLICVICTACCHSSYSLTSIFSMSDVDHPDFEPRRSKWKFGSIYRNPSVPIKRNDFSVSFWKRLSIDLWKANNQTSNLSHDSTSIYNIYNHIKMMTLRESYESASTRKFSTIAYDETYPSTNILRVHVDDWRKSWDVLLPRYNPPFYCKPVDEFASNFQKYVESPTEQKIGELRRAWRGRQAADSLNAKSWKISAAGFPLNPNGRTGISGRGNHVQFGSNRKHTYILLSLNNNCPQLLVDAKSDLPSEWHFDHSSSKDDFLASLLKMIGIQITDVNMLSMRRMDNSIISSDKRLSPQQMTPIYVALKVVPDENDTDNAWTEHDVWAIPISNRTVRETLENGYRWMQLESRSLSFWQNELVEKTLNIYGI